MNSPTIRDAIAEAERFLRAAKAARVSVEKAERDNDVPDGRLTAAAKRASMDLTRALAKLRGRSQ